MGRAQLKGPNGLGPNGIGGGPKWAGPNRHMTKLEKSKHWSAYRKHWSAVFIEKSKLCVFQHSTFKRKYLIKKGSI